ncbi:MAG: ABC transporter substrate-binding protein [Halobacteriota archaeon]
MSIESIVSLAPSVTETLASMRQAHRLVGVTSHCPVDRPAVGSWLRPDFERLSELDPSIVCTNDALQSTVRDELVDRGYDVFHAEPTRLSDVVSGFEALGTAVGAPVAGKTLAEDATERLERISTRVEGMDRPTVYCEEWSDPPMAAGNWVPEAVAVAGGRYPFVDPGDRSREVSPAQVESESPSHAVLHICGRGTDVSPDRLSSRGWAIDPQVHVFDDSLLNQPSPRLLEGIERLAFLLHPNF